MLQQLTIRIDSYGREEVFDPIRKKYVLLTPEERVRQGLILFLTQQKGYPSGLLKVEVGLTLNGMAKRTDIMVYGRDAKPLVIVECKAESVKLSQAVFNQLACYNLAYKVPYLIASNGRQHYCCKVDIKAGSIAFLKEIPHYSEL